MFLGTSFIFSGLDMVSSKNLINNMENELKYIKKNWPNEIRKEKINSNLFKDNKFFYKNGF